VDIPEEHEPENQRLLEQCEKVIQLEARLHSPKSVIQGGSTFDSDDDAVNPLYLSSAASLLNAASIDHLLALRAVLLAQGVPAAAGYTLLRGAFEAGLGAVWLLSSDDPQVRRRRLLQDAWADFNNANWFFEVGGSASESLMSRKARIDSAATSAGIPSASFRIRAMTSEKVKAVQPFVQTQLGLLHDDAGMIRLWRMLSGVAHSTNHAFELFLVVEASEFANANGTYETAFSSNRQLFVTIMTLVVNVIELAIELYELRARPR
jgi:hypothetical protein